MKDRKLVNMGSLGKMLISQTGNGEIEIMINYTDMSPIAIIPVSGNVIKIRKVGD
jgi:hypothetical protein